MDLFSDIAPESRQHPIYRLLKGSRYGPERAVVRQWAEGFSDRDGKFTYEFQSTFEPCFWELYLNACLKELGYRMDFSHARPDFVVSGTQEFCMEATTALPAQGGMPPHGFRINDIPDDLNDFNSLATLRICNSFSAKERKYRESYAALDHVQDKPFVIALAPYDRPFSHMAAGRPIVSALYGFYHDEMRTMAAKLDRLLAYTVEGVKKTEAATVPLGYFQDRSFSHVSAVVYSHLATWGKIRALADNPTACAVYTTLHPSEGSLMPEMRVAPKSEYHENLLDGLYIFHNPYADRPLEKNAFNHPRVAQFFPSSNGEIEVVAPDDFLLFRYVQSFSAREENREA